MTRCSRRVVTKPHQRRQARWLETLDWAWPSRRVSAPADSSPSAWSSSRMRSRVGSPRARKYLATRSPRAGASGRRNGASSATDSPFQNFLIRASTGGHPLVNSKPRQAARRRGAHLQDLLARPSSSLTAVQQASVRRRVQPGHFAISMASTPPRASRRVQLALAWLLEVVTDYKRLSAVQGRGQAGHGRARGPQYPGVAAHATL